MKRKKIVIEVEEGYEPIVRVMYLALVRLIDGKGEERHTPPGPPKPIREQQICNTRREVGPGFTMGQIAKKAYEAARTEDRDRRITECLDIINYAAAEAVVSLEPDKFTFEPGPKVSMKS